MNPEIENYRQDLHMSVGVMKDKRLKMRNLHTSHTLGCSDINILFTMNQESKK
jgi:hypothetical protein